MIGRAGLSWKVPALELYQAACKGPSCLQSCQNKTIILVATLEVDQMHIGVKLLWKFMGPCLAAPYTHLDHNPSVLVCWMQNAPAQPLPFDIAADGLALLDDFAAMSLLLLLLLLLRRLPLLLPMALAAAAALTVA